MGLPCVIGRATQPRRARREESRRIRCRNESMDVGNRCASGFAGFRFSGLAFRAFRKAPTLATVAQRLRTGLAGASHVLSAESRDQTTRPPARHRLTGTGTEMAQQKQRGKFVLGSLLLPRCTRQRAHGPEYNRK